MALTILIAVETQSEREYHKLLCWERLSTLENDLQKSKTEIYTLLKKKREISKNKKT